MIQTKTPKKIKGARKSDQHKGERKPQGQEKFSTPKSLKSGKHIIFRNIYSIHARKLRNL